MEFKTFADLEQCLYYYRASVVSNYDGDTVRLRVDLGLEAGVGVFGRGVAFRLYGINTPELYGADKLKGRESKLALENLVRDRTLIIRTQKAPKGEDKRGKYGRYLVTLYFEGDDGGIIDINAWLVGEGLAEWKSYD